MSLPEPRYVRVDSVRVRLAGKVQVQADPRKPSEREYVEDGTMPYELLLQLICDAETEIEQELRSRYAVPFVSRTTGMFSDLPYHSKRALCQVIEDKAVLLVLETDFGTGTHNSAEGYRTNVQSRMDARLELLLGKDREGNNAKIDRYKNSAPLDDLMLAPWNSESADNGMKGEVILTDMGRNRGMRYAEDRINDPSRSFFGPYGIIRGGR